MSFSLSIIYKHLFYIYLFFPISNILSSRMCVCFLTEYVDFKCLIFKLYNQLHVIFMLSVYELYTLIDSILRNWAWNYDLTHSSCMAFDTSVWEQNRIVIIVIPEHCLPSRHSTCAVCALWRCCTFVHFDQNKSENKTLHITSLAHASLHITSNKACWTSLNESNFLVRLHTHANIEHNV